MPGASAARWHAFEPKQHPNPTVSGDTSPLALALPPED